MKNPIIFLALLFMNSLYAQSLKDFDLNTQTFNLNTYNEKNENGDYQYNLTQDISVFQHYIDHEIKETIRQQDSPYTVERIYDYPSGRLRYAKKLFYNFSMGMAISYDEKGNSKDSINWDYGYNFSVDDLIQKMNTDYRIDLSVPKQGIDNLGIPRQAIEVNRYFILPKEDLTPLYIVSIHYNLLKQDSIVRDGALVKYRKFYVDGTNGYSTVEDYAELKRYFENDREYSIARYYEMNAQLELMKIREQKLEWKGNYSNVEEEKVIFEQSNKANGAYKTYKGKSYTQEEWIKFEEQQYLAYLKKRKGFL